MKKNKVLILTSTFPRWTGDTNPPFVYELSKRLAKKIDITVLAPNSPKAKSYEVMEGIKTYRYRYFFSPLEKLAGNGGIIPVLKKNKCYYLVTPFFILGQLIAAIKLVKADRPSTVHAHWIIPQGLVALFIKKIFKIPYIITSHGGDIFSLQGSVFFWLKYQVLTNADKITVVSSAIKKEVLKINPKLVNRIKVIPMGVDASKFNPSKYDESIKQKYDINGPLLLFVGRLAEKKGVKYLLEAMPAILKKNPKTKLLVVGSGVLESSLKNLSLKLKINNNVIFTGPIENSELPKYYATSDIFIGPSVKTKDGDTEGFGLTFVEAMMSGCQIIGTDVGGISDIVEKNKLIKPMDPASIEKKVRELLDSCEKDIKTIKNSNKRYSKKFDWENISQRYLTVINQ